MIPILGRKLFKVFDDFHRCFSGTFWSVLRAEHPDPLEPGQRLEPTTFT